MNQKTLWALAAGALLFAGPGHATRDGLNSPIAEPKGTSNIMGMIPGNDPKLSNEVIIISAHGDQGPKKMTCGQ